MRKREKHKRNERTQIFVQKFIGLVTDRPQGFSYFRLRFRLRLRFCQTHQHYSAALHCTPLLERNAQLGPCACRGRSR